MATSCSLTLCHPVLTKQRVSYLYLVFFKSDLRPTSSLRPLYYLPSLLPPIAGEGNSALSPLNPGELLIALHNIDSVKCDMKSIIKGETPLSLHGPAPMDLGRGLSNLHDSTGLKTITHCCTYPILALASVWAVPPTLL